MTKHQKEKPIFPKKGTISSIGMISCCLNSAISLGSLRLGSTFTSGLLFTYLIFMIIGIFSFYSLKLLVLSATAYHESAFIEIWRVAFSNKTIFFPVIVSVLSSVIDMVEYIREIQTSLIIICSKILHLASKNDKRIIIDLKSYELLIGVVIFFVFLLPICMTAHINTMVNLSHIAVICISVFTIYIIGIFAYHVKIYGFNPDRSFKLFQFKGRFVKSLASSIFSYNFYPLTYPGIRHIQNSTKSNLIKVFAISITIIFVDYMIIGTFSYLTYFDKNTYGTVFDYFPQNSNTEIILLIFGRLITLLFVLMTIPFRINSSRYIILNLTSTLTSFPTDIWMFSGIILSLISLALANLTQDMINVMYIISDIIASILMFVFTPLFYLKGFGMRDRFNAFMSILLLCFGIITAICMIIYDGFF